MIGCSLDKADASRAFAEKFSFPFPLIPDGDRSISIAYGAAETPREELARRIAFLIDPEGRVVEAHAKVDPPTYPREQLESLRRRVSERGSGG